MWENERSELVEQANKLSNAVADSTRLRGEIINRGENAVARTEIMAEALSCPPAKACEVLYGERMTLSMHIPAGGRYPLNLSVPRPDREIQAERWRARVLRVEAYDH